MLTKFKLINLIRGLSLSLLISSCAIAMVEPEIMQENRAEEAIHLVVHKPSGEVYVEGRMDLVRVVIDDVAGSSIRLVLPQLVGEPVIAGGNASITCAFIPLRPVGGIIMKHDGESTFRKEMGEENDFSIEVTVGNNLLNGVQDLLRQRARESGKCAPIVSLPVVEQLRALGELTFSDFKGIYRKFTQPHPIGVTCKYTEYTEGDRFIFEFTNPLTVDKVKLDLPGRYMRIVRPHFEEIRDGIFRIGPKPASDILSLQPKVYEELLRCILGYSLAPLSAASMQDEIEGIRLIVLNRLNELAKCNPR